MAKFEIEHYSEFSVRVFEHLNGRINLVNNSINLYIYPYGLGHNIYAMFSNASTLILYLSDILRLYNYVGENEMKNIILFVITHELYHVDNRICHNEYKMNDKYSKQIEDTIDYMSIIYILTNYKDIEDHLDIDVDIEFFNGLLNTINTPIRYRRASNLYEFYYITLGIMFEQFFKLSELLYYGNNIKIKVGDDVAIVKHDGIFNEDTSALVSIFHNNYKDRNIITQSISCNYVDGYHVLEIIPGPKQAIVFLERITENAMF